MKATLGTLPVDDHRWAYEIKWDGYRTLAFVDGGSVRLQSTNLHDVTAKYPELGELATGVHAGTAVLDGELVVLDDDGRPRFELMQRHERPAILHVFDVLRVDDHDTTELPYESRRQLLDQLVEPGDNWLVPGHRIGGGRELLGATDEQGLEGVMAKRLGSTTFGSLLVGRHDGGSLVFAGGVGTGFDQTLLESLSDRLRHLETAECPFDPQPPATYRRAARWVTPQLTATIELTEFTNDGLVRHASFVELHEGTN
jgi:bifunctional non-homologous end joining protein LigD